MIKYSKKINVRHGYMEIAVGQVVDKECGDIIYFCLFSQSFLILNTVRGEPRIMPVPLNSLGERACCGGYVYFERESMYVRASLWLTYQLKRFNVVPVSIINISLLETKIATIVQYLLSVCSPHIIL